MTHENWADEGGRVVRVNKIYIAGPMSSIKDFNFPAFFAAEHDLKRRGWRVFNPARKDIETYGFEMFHGDGDVAAVENKGFDKRRAFAWDCARICESHAIYMLDGWEYSTGARAEWTLALALGLTILYDGD